MSDRLKISEMPIAPNTAGFEFAGVKDGQNARLTIGLLLSRLFPSAPAAEDALSAVLDALQAAKEEIEGGAGALPALNALVAAAEQASTGAQSAAALAGSFLTRAAAVAGVSSFTDGRRVEVTDDPNPALIGSYTVTGGTIPAQPNSRLTVAAVAELAAALKAAPSWVYTVDWLNDGTRHYRRSAAGQVIGRTMADGIRVSWGGGAYLRRDRSSEDDDAVGVAQRWTYTVDWLNRGVAHMRRGVAGQVTAERFRDASEREWTGLAYAAKGGVNALPATSAPASHPIREEAMRAAARIVRDATLTAPALIVPPEAAVPPVASRDTAAYGYGRSGTAIPNADFTLRGRKFRINVQRNDHDPGYIEGNGNPVGGEGPGAYNRIGFSDDLGAAWAYPDFLLPADNTKSVLDPYAKCLVDGSMLFLTSVSHGGARRSIFSRVLLNPDDPPAEWNWGPIRFVDYGFASVPEYVGNELLFFACQPIIAPSASNPGPFYDSDQEDWHGAKLCALRIYAGGEVRSERISRLPWLHNPDGTISPFNTFWEPSIIPVGHSGMLVPFRTTEGYYVTTSDRMGDPGTWSTPVPWAPFPAIASRHHFARSPSGVLWCAGHDVPLGDARRRSMIRASLDDGRTWPAALSYCWDPREPQSYWRISFETTRRGAYSGFIHIDGDRGRGRAQDATAPTGWLSELVQGRFNERAFLEGARAVPITTTER